MINDLMWYVAAAWFMGICLWLRVLPTRSRKLGRAYAPGGHRKTAYRKSAKKEVCNLLFVLSFVLWMYTAWQFIHHIGAS